MRLKAFCAAVLALVLLAGCNAAEDHDHDFDKEPVTLTCTQDSGIRYTCDCGYSYLDVDTRAAGHDYETVEIEPADGLPGYSQHTCRVCGDIYQDNFTGEIPESETTPEGSSEPEDTELQGTEPQGTEPEGTEPQGTEPQDTEPQDGTEPKDTEGTEPVEDTPADSGEVLHFFDDAAFIGDSASLKLQRYQAEHGVLGSATFLTAGSYSVYHAINDTMFVSYRGQQMSPEDALAACGAKKVFILLGMNDIGRRDVGVDKAIDNWAVFLQRIRSKNPDIEIYIQSGTPIHAAGEKGMLSNANMDRYNEKLKDFAAQNGCHYVDIATAMKDANGALKNEYCSDQYVHLSDAGCVAWIGVLRSYVGG